MRRVLPCAALVLLAACQAHRATTAAAPAPAAPAEAAAPGVAVSSSSVGGTAAPMDLEQRLLADVRTSEAQFGANHPRIAKEYLKLAEFHRKHGNPEKEKQWLASAWKAAEAGVAAMNPIAGLALEAISAYHRRHGDPKAAAEVYDDAVEVMEKEEGARHPLLVDSTLALAETYRSQGRHGEAVEAYNKAFKAARGQWGGSHPKAIAALTGMSASLEAEGEADEAKKTLGMAIDLSGDALESKLPDLAALHGQMGDKLAGQADYQGALVHYQKQLSILRVIKTSSDPALFQPRAKLGDDLAALSRNADAEAQYEDLLGDMERAYGVKSANLAWLLQKLQAFYAAIGRSRDAAAASTRLAGLDPVPAYAGVPASYAASASTATAARTTASPPGPGASATQTPGW